MKRLETMKTIAFDIKDAVFDNETEAIMYVTKDIYSESYVIAIPIISFGWDIRHENDYKHLLKSNTFGDRDRQGRLVKAIREAIKEFE